MSPLASVSAIDFTADPGVVLGDALLLAVAAFAHAGPTRQILRQAKYGGGRRAIAILAAAALPALARLLEVTGPAVLVPVPLHRTRRRDRGYNQASILADELGRGARTPVWPALIRARETARQHALDRATRLRNLTSSMERSPAPVPAGAFGRAVIVVDDILTTGATLEACAMVLRDAGVGAVYGFAIAREI